MPKMALEPGARPGPNAMQFLALVLAKYRNRSLFTVRQGLTRRFLFSSTQVFLGVECESLEWLRGHSCAQL